MEESKSIGDFQLFLCLEYTGKLLDKLKEAGFTTKEIQYPGSWLFTINLYLSLILKYMFKQRLMVKAGKGGEKVA